MVFVFAFLRLLFVCAFLHLSLHACVFAFLRLQPPAFLATCTAATVYCRRHVLP